VTLFLGIVISLLALVLAVRGLKDPFTAVIGLFVVHMCQPGQLIAAVGHLYPEKIMAGVALLSIWRHHRKLRMTPVIKAMLVFFGACVASIPLSLWVANAVTELESFGKIIILAVLVTVVIQERGQVLRFLQAFAAIMGYLAITSAIWYYTGHYAYAEGFQRIIGLTDIVGATDGLALTMASAVPLILVLTTRGKNWRYRGFMLVMAGACLWVMLLTGSRVTMIAFVAGMGFGVLTSRRRMLLITSTLLALAVIWTVLPEQYKVRYTKQTSSEYLAQADSYVERLRIWHDGWDMFLKHPVTGVGIGDFNAIEGLYYWRHHMMDAHNLFIKTVAELGVVGLFCFAGFVVVLARTNRALLRTLKSMDDVPAWLLAYPRAANIAVIILLLTGYGAHDLYRDTWYIMAAVSGSLWLLLHDEGHKVSFRRLSREEMNPPRPEEAVASAPALPALTAFGGLR
jgi:O-antigen ligase